MAQQTSNRAHSRGRKRQPQEEPDDNRSAEETLERPEGEPAAERGQTADERSMPGPPSVTEL
jgi:hypothetical protein